MRLEPLYRIRFTYPESWAVGLDGGWQQMFFIAEGRCEGAVTGRFRGANFPRKEGPAGPFRPDFRAVIETDDGAAIIYASASTQKLRTSMLRSAPAVGRSAKRLLPRLWAAGRSA